MKTYVLNRDWAPFSKGDLFKGDGADDKLYTLASNNTVLVKIPDGYLDEYGQHYAWHPDNDEPYYFLTDTAEIGEELFSAKDVTHEDRLAICNCFKTLKEAEDMRKWLYARRDLIRSGAKFVNKADGSLPSVRYSKRANKLEVYYPICHDDDYLYHKMLCFIGASIAERSIERCKDDWLVYLGVKEKSGEEE